MSWRRRKLKRQLSSVWKRVVTWHLLLTPPLCVSPLGVDYRTVAAAEINSNPTIVNTSCWCAHPVGSHSRHATTADERANKGDDKCTRIAFVGCPWQEQQCNTRQIMHRDWWQVAGVSMTTSEPGANVATKATRRRWRGRKHKNGNCKVWEIGLYYKQHVVVGCAT